VLQFGEAVLLLYLDLNCFNRPFDDQSQKRIADETAAVLAILHRIEIGEDQLAWSAVLAFENSQHPLYDRNQEIARWHHWASAVIAIDSQIASRAKQLNIAGMKPLDAAHVACAEQGQCKRFLTCDDRLLRIARNLNLKLIAQNPLDYLKDYNHA
jgi:predicted nucleic acid-binding protein